MSGHKRATVTIDQEEYQRLHEVDAKLRLVQKSQIDKNTVEHYQNAVQQEYNRLYDRQDQYQGCIDHLNDQMQSIETRICQDYSKQQEWFYTQANQITSNLWSGVDQILDEQQNIFQTQINSLYQQQNEQSIQIRQIEQDIRTDQLRKEQYARSWIEATEIIAGFIENQYDYQKFSPGRLEEIWNDLAIAEENIGAGVPEAAISTTQQAYRNCSRLRLELEYAENQWRLIYIATCEMIDHLYEIVQSNWCIPAVDLDGNELGQVIDVDYWCGGKLTQEIKQLEIIRDQLQSNGTKLTLEDLKQFLNNLLPEIENRIHECRFQARLAALSSQIRINIADVALTALEQQGFLIDQSGYDRHDQRSGFTATTRSMDGGQVVVKVVPSLDEIGKNDLHVHSLDSDGKTQHELRLRAETIRKNLAKCGLDVSEMEISNDSQSTYQPLKPKIKKISDTNQQVIRN